MFETGIKLNFLYCLHRSTTLYIYIGLFKVRNLTRLYVPYIFLIFYALYPNISF